MEARAIVEKGRWTQIALAGLALILLGVGALFESWSFGVCELNAESEGCTTKLGHLGVAAFLQSVGAGFALLPGDALFERRWPRISEKNRGLTSAIACFVIGVLCCLTVFTFGPFLLQSTVVALLLVLFFLFAKEVFVWICEIEARAVRPPPNPGIRESKRTVAGAAELAQAEDGVGSSSRPAI